MKINEISVVIPILNEEKNLIKLINSIKKVRRKIKLKNFEVIFIDDNSTDGTEKLMKSIIKKNNFIRHFIRKNKKKDLSKSCIMGFDKSCYANIIVMDGDLQHPPRFIENMWKKFYFNNADIVIGSRNLFNKKIQV